MAQITLWLPSTFWHDHQERGLPSGEKIGHVQNRVLISCTHEELIEIKSDAEFYAHTNGPDWEDGDAIRASAKRTVKAIAKFENTPTD
jgi:hypothetical protein